MKFSHKKEGFPKMIPTISQVVYSKNKEPADPGVLRDAQEYFNSFQCINGKIVKNQEKIVNLNDPNFSNNVSRKQFEKMLSH